MNGHADVDGMSADNIKDAPTSCLMLRELVRLERNVDLFLSGSRDSFIENPTSEPLKETDNRDYQHPVKGKPNELDMVTESEDFLIEVPGAYGVPTLYGFSPVSVLYGKSGSFEVKYELGSGEKISVLTGLLSLKDMSTFISSQYHSYHLGIHLDSETVDIIGRSQSDDADYETWVGRITTTKLYK